MIKNDMVRFLSNLKAEAMVAQGKATVRRGGSGKCDCGCGCGCSKEGKPKEVDPVGYAYEKTELIAKGTEVIESGMKVAIKFKDEGGNTGRIEFPDLGDLLQLAEQYTTYDDDEEEDEDEDEETTPDKFKLDEDGFFLLHHPKHPLADEDGYYPVHRFFLEGYLWRQCQYKHLALDRVKGVPFYYLDPDVPVVFLDGNPGNLEIDNLALLPPELEEHEIIQRMIESGNLTLDME